MYVVNFIHQKATIVVLVAFTFGTVSTSAQHMLDMHMLHELLVRQREEVEPHYVHTANKGQ